MAAQKGWVTVAVREDLIARVDKFLEKNTDGFHSRGEVTAAALRDFLAKYEPRPPV